MVQTAENHELETNTYVEENLSCLEALRQLLTRALSAIEQNKPLCPVASLSVEMVYFGFITNLSFHEFPEGKLCR